MNERFDVPLSELTTLRIGGPARRLVEAVSAEEIVEVVGEADARGEPLLVMGSGSNLLVSDDGFDGTVLRLASAGIDVLSQGDAVRLTVAAGEGWDDFIRRCVAERWAGVECLSGIPGRTGATPIQNVGAYGEEVAQTIIGVRAYDRQAAAVLELSTAQCGFAYRSSAFKGSARYVVLEVTFMLEPSAEARPLRYPELARALGAQPGDRPPLSEVRDAVIELRRSKGMVLDPDDPDSISAGSFFLNPLLDTDQAEDFMRRARQRLGEEVSVPSWPEADGRTKVSAAWLIQQAGFTRGHGSGRAGISGKHALALVNRGGASAGEVAALARELRDRVQEAFGVKLTPEPTLVGVVI